MPKESTIARLYEACDSDADYEALDRIAIAAGILWRCRADDCGYNNPETAKKCDDCGAPRPA